jgi:hypothetical protein
MSQKIIYAAPGDFNTSKSAFSIDESKGDFVTFA